MTAYRIGEDQVRGSAALRDFVLAYVGSLEAEVTPHYGHNRTLIPASTKLHSAFGFNPDGQNSPSNSSNSSGSAFALAIHSFIAGIFMIVLQ